VVGLYVAPPAHAVVLSIDEKSQIQALERTQPGLPSPALKPDFSRCELARVYAQLGKPPQELLSGNSETHLAIGDWSRLFRRCSCVSLSRINWRAWTA